VRRLMVCAPTIENHNCFCRGIPRNHKNLKDYFSTAETRYV
jgi:hypothetical protein